MLSSRDSSRACGCIGLPARIKCGVSNVRLCPNAPVPHDSFSPASPPPPVDRLPADAHPGSLQSWDLVRTRSWEKQDSEDTAELPLPEVDTVSQEPVPPLPPTAAECDTSDDSYLLLEDPIAELPKRASLRCDPVSPASHSLVQQFAKQAVTAWLPLDSSPFGLNEFSYLAGMPTEWEWCDMYGLQEDYLKLVPQPAVAVLVTYSGQAAGPICDFKQQQRQSRHPQFYLTAGQAGLPDSTAFYMRQRVRHAGCMVAAVHAIANCSEHFQLQPDCMLMQLFNQCTNTTAFGEKGRIFAENHQFRQAAEECAGAVTQLPDEEQYCSAFVSVSGRLIELDGAWEEQPVVHGSTTPETFLNDVASVLHSDYVTQLEQNEWFKDDSLIMFALASAKSCEAD